MKIFNKDIKLGKSEIISFAIGLLSAFVSSKLPVFYHLFCNCN